MLRPLFSKTQSNSLRAPELGFPPDLFDLDSGRSTQEIQALFAASTFSLIPPTGQDETAQTDLAGHRDIFADNTSTGAKVRRWQRDGV